MNAEQSYNVMHPGFYLKKELRLRKITQKDFAHDLGVQPSHLSELVTGKRNFTKQLAIKLEQLLHIPAATWMRMQAEHDYRVKKEVAKTDPECNAEKELMLYNEIYDMKELFKRVGMSKAMPSEKLSFCRDKLRFGTLSQQRSLNEGYYHKSEKTGLDTRMISTWSVLAMYQASLEPMPTGIFDKSKCASLAKELSSIFNDNCNTINRISRKLSEYGIKFCIVDKMKHASIDGFSFYIDGIPAIVVSKRFNRIDNLAFAVLHELGHLDMHLSTNGVGKVNVVDPDAEKLCSIEQQANAYAANALIPKELWETQPPVQLINPFVVQKSFSNFARRIKKNKWIVLGRISYETNFYMFKSDSSREIH